ncbi:MAG TPA: tyrosine-type recombinase/integrase [Pseudolabrys sp.]|nr:tyrosine-type recombinase/integrase [Pseudolabrys sp.]
MGRPSSNGGAHKTTKRLADGSKVDYWYAWKGGPRLLSAPTDKDAFARELSEARAIRSQPPQQSTTPKRGKSTDTLEYVVDTYLDSQDFLTCSERTRNDYRRQATIILGQFRELELKALNEEPDGTRGEFLDYRDRLAKASPRQADYFLQVLNTILNWGKVRGKLKLNPLRDAGVKKLYSVTRADKIWSDAEIDAFQAAATKEIAFAQTLALWTGQRQGDLLSLPWSAYDGATIKLSQAKSEGKRNMRVKVTIHVAAPLKKALDAAPRKSPIILVTQDGQPWTPDGFRTMWHKSAKRAKIVDRTFHDLRGTTVVWLARAGCSEPEIAGVTGHAISQVKTILEHHYLGRDAEVGRNAITKLEAWKAQKRERPYARQVSPG